MSKSERAVLLVDENYAIAFPEEGDFIEESEDGGLSILVDIYKIVGDKRVNVSGDEVTEELRTKIEAFVNAILMEAVDKELGDDNVKD